LDWHRVGKQAPDQRWLEDQGLERRRVVARISVKVAGLECADGSTWCVDGPSSIRGNAVSGVDGHELEPLVKNSPVRGVGVTAERLDAGD
jgi:hypothetical protein